MMQRDGPAPDPGAAETRLADVAMLISERLDAGEAVDLDSVAERYPDCAQPIRQLLPTLQDLCTFGRIAASPGAPGLPGGKPNVGF
ncbi:hypothetical protein [Aquisphaera insulae]|uniref:hypothetical protein n=1 Tax=Aquisphaera insulae TaxID=2712864 RepID=UPI0013EE0DAE|nr:hypothetical protein [Aquisphaera insulae]